MSLYRWRRGVLLAWLLTLVGCALLLWLRPPAPLETELTGASGTPADQVQQLLRADFDQRLGASADLVVRGAVDLDDLTASLTARVPAVKRARALTGVRPHTLKLIHLEFDPALALTEAQARTPELRAWAGEYARAHGAQIEVTGGTAFQFDAKDASKRDSRRGESASVLVSLVVLVCTLGAPLAALMPLLAGVTTVLEFNALADAFGLAINPVSKVLTTLVGMALAIDYAIFLVSRFREELQRGAAPEQAAAVMLRYTGRTVAFSAVIMAASLAALLVPDVSLCRVVVENLLLVVGLSVANALVLLPALLTWRPALLNWPKGLTTRIADLRSERLWTAVTQHVVAHPLLTFVVALGAIAALTAPVLDIKLWEPVQAIAPHDAESMLAYNRLRADGWGGELMPVIIAVKAPPGRRVFEPETLQTVDALTRALRASPHVTAVASLTSWRPNADVTAYAKLYKALDHLGLATTSPRLRGLVGAKGDVTLVEVFPRDLMKLDDTDAILDLANAFATAHPATPVLVGGVVARIRDFTHELYRNAPWLVAWVVGAIYVLLLFYMRSVILPLKAAVMNFMPILGAYGVLVLVFQRGVGASLLHTPVNGAVTNLVPIMLFCIVFGLSMDYEVLMLGRITEAYRETDDVAAAVILGMGRSGAVITGAALILLGVFATGIGSSSPQTQEICLGITAALAIDATIVRFLLVPSFMVLLGRWNWWSPFGYLAQSVVAAQPEQP